MHAVSYGKTYRNAAGAYWLLKEDSFYTAPVTVGGVHSDFSSSYIGRKLNGIYSKYAPEAK